MSTLISVEREWPCSRPAERGGNADGQVAGDLLGADAFGGKGEHVGGFVLAAKLAIELADGGVGGQQHGDLALEADGGLRSARKRARVRAEGQAKVAGGGSRTQQSASPKLSSARGRGPNLGREGSSCSGPQRMRPRNFILRGFQFYASGDRWGIAVLPDCGLAGCKGCGPILRGAGADFDGFAEGQRQLLLLDLTDS
jgi:hypothetical protein